MQADGGDRQDGWVPSWCVLSGRQFSYDAHWRSIPGRPGGRTPVGDPAAAASRARAKAIAEGLQLNTGPYVPTVLNLDECDVEPAAAGRSRTFCVALKHRPSGARLLMQCQTELERGRWVDLATECSDRSKIWAAEQAVIEAEADARERLLAMQAADELALAAAGSEGGDQPFGQMALVCPAGGQPLHIPRTRTFSRSDRETFSLAPVSSRAIFHYS